SFFSSNSNLKNTNAYKHYLDSPSINSEMDLKEAANRAMADQMMTCVAFELMRKLPNGDINRFLDGTVLDISLNEDILRFLEKYFDKEDLENYVTRVNLLDVKKEIRILSNCAEKIRSEEKRMSENILVQ